MTEKKPKRRVPMAVGEALQGYLTRSGLGQRLAQAQVVTEWPTLVGPQVATVTKPESVSPDGTLFVRVATSAWMNELQFQMPELMARINAGRGAGHIRTIRWLLAR
jgi:predicted nucleic acid-binding Zn ribbon protein